MLLDDHRSPCIDNGKRVFLKTQVDLKWGGVGRLKTHLDHVLWKLIIRIYGRGRGMLALNVKDDSALTIKALCGYFKEFNAKGQGKVAHGSRIFCSYLF